MQGLVNIPVKGLDVDLLSDIFDKAWIAKVNAGLKSASVDANVKLLCYFAYQVAAPIQNLLLKTLNHASVVR
jgi:hypothetical protein